MTVSRRKFIAGASASIVLAGCTGSGQSGNGSGGGSGGNGSGGGSGGNGSGGGSGGNGSGGGSGGNGSGGGSAATWRYGTSNEGSGAAQMGNAYAVLFEKNSNQVGISPQTTQGYIQNMRLMDQQQMDVMFSHTIVAQWAYESQGPFEENPVDVRPVQGHPTNQVLNHHFLVKPGDGVTSVKDIAGKTAAIGAPGSSLGALAQSILKAEGVLDQVETQRMTFTEAKSAFRAGNIDAFFTGIINMQTNAASLEVWQTMDVDIATMSDDALEMLTEINPFFSVATVDTSHPKWPSEMNTQYDTLRLPQVIAYGLLQRNLSEDDVYHSLKVFHENQEQLGELNSSLWGIGWGTVELDGQEIDRWGIQGALTTVPFHPGAKRYLEEIDYWNSDWKVAEE